MKAGTRLATCTWAGIGIAGLVAVACAVAAPNPASSTKKEDGFQTPVTAAILLDAEGNLTICGRSKDLIKSGGEWINPAEMEAIVGRDPTVGAVAVIGRADAKWGERPVLVVQPRQNQTVDPAALIAGLRGKVADWWLPTEVAELEKMPLAATGKIDKRRLREDFEAGAIEARPIASR